MKFILFILAALFVAGLNAAKQINNCELTQAQLTADKNTCIDLSLCPTLGGAPAICPFVYFPVCGKNLNTNKLTSQFMRRAPECVSANHEYLGCDGQTYSNSCYAKLSGVTTHTLGACANLRG